MFLAAPNSVSFSQLPAVKKDIIFDEAKKTLGPSFFVTALVLVIVVLIFFISNSIAVSVHLGKKFLRKISS